MLTILAERPPALWQKVLRLLDFLCVDILINVLIIFGVIISVYWLSGEFARLTYTQVLDHVEFNDAPMLVTLMELTVDAVHSDGLNIDLLGYSAFTAALVLVNHWHKKAQMGIAYAETIILWLAAIFLLQYLLYKIWPGSLILKVLTPFSVGAILCAPRALIILFSRHGHIRERLTRGAHSAMRSFNRFKLPEFHEFWRVALYLIKTLFLVLISQPIIVAAFFFVVEFVNLFYLDAYVLTNIVVSTLLQREADFSISLYCAGAISISIIVLTLVKVFRDKSRGDRILATLLLNFSIVIAYIVSVPIYAPLFWGNYEVLVSFRGLLLIYAFGAMSWQAFMYLRVRIALILKNFIDQTRPFFLKRYQDFGDSPDADYLLLRAFKDDFLALKKQSVVYTWLLGLRDYQIRIEEVIVDVTAGLGSVVSLENPYLKRRLRGAIREQATDTDWQDKALRFIENSKKIVFVLGATANLSWELGQILEKGYGKKLILILPPDYGGKFTIGDTSPSLLKHLGIDDIFEKAHMGDMKILFYSEKAESYMALCDRKTDAATFSRLLNVAVYDDIFTKIQR